ncbi:uncharacterized protein EI97DRAFT_430441 [Westerdykella ornata]|uniref:Inner kinetochore subunit AME1 domain-containing protein n=1 Tax=Westerdykella ornata TaxID=318751 RepID=A0A6A6JRW4_WESOR|nr:uncharacterized protein EI97DRAFT_430441 [Westerdykella ornata]KAF2279361.1 hypothetical protein EI97DRAFT_430441 [Westerdykella ornata]
MAPLDRAEHRQQRMRGAGVANVQTNFSFNLGALSRPAKQVSLPPPLPRTRTPVANTPPGRPGSAQRHRSASVKSSSVKRGPQTARQGIVTPQLGKRKRGSDEAAGTDANDVDELSPEHHLGNPSPTEIAIRIAKTVSPVREVDDDMQDELSLLDVVNHEAPASLFTKPVRNDSSTPKIRDTPSNIDNQARGLSKPVPVTPVGPIIRKQRLDQKVGQTGQAPEGNRKERGLSQPDSDIRQSASHNKSTAGETFIEDDVDELSPEQSSARGFQSASTTQAFLQQTPTISTGQRGPESTTSPKGGRLRVMATHEDDEEEDIVQSTPALDKPRRIQRESIDVAESRRGSEANPDHEDHGAHTARRERDQARRSPEESGGKSPSPEEFDDGQQESDEIPPMQRRTPPFRARAPGKKTMTKLPAEKPAKKRRKTGPSQIIQVMRLKGFAVNALTVVDTTRNLMEEWTTHRINKMTEQLTNVNDGSRAKLIRHHRNVILAYRDQLEDDLLELQDANDTSIDNVKKLKQFSSENKRLRKEYFQLQRDREQIALETDDITEGFLNEKKDIETRHGLSSSLYDIQAAIQSGKEKARAEGRENEGPELPLNMLLENVSMNFGQSTGLLWKIKDLNGFLGKTASLLERKV